MQLLCYSGRIHVRDLALMLEEVLYYYRVDGQPLSDAMIQRVLTEYDQWVTVKATPLDIELVLAATTLLSEEKEVPTGKGYFQQQAWVGSVMRFGKYIQEDLSNRVDSSPNSSFRVAVRLSVRWSDIRLLIDAEDGVGAAAGVGGATTPTGASFKGSTKASQRSPKLSVVARAELKRKSKATVTIAHSAVPFHKFARWLYHQLDTHNN